jgi:hypothetical protein
VALVTAGCGGSVLDEYVYARARSAIFCVSVHTVCAHTVLSDGGTVARRVGDSVFCRGATFVDATTGRRLGMPIF